MLDGVCAVVPAVVDLHGDLLLPGECARILQNQLGAVQGSAALGCITVPIHQLKHETAFGGKSTRIDPRLRHRRRVCHFLRIGVKIAPVQFVLQLLCRFVPRRRSFEKPIQRRGVEHHPEALQIVMVVVVILVGPGGAVTGDGPRRRRSGPILIEEKLHRFRGVGIDARHTAAGRILVLQRHLHAGLAAARLFDLSPKNIALSVFRPKGGRQLCRRQADCQQCRAQTFSKARLHAIFLPILFSRRKENHDLWKALYRPFSMNSIALRNFSGHLSEYLLF